MKCPTCATDLVMADRQGVEIDYCPKCRGVWLDRGELDKIIERSMTSVASAGGDYDQPRRPPKHHDRDHEDRGYYDDDHHRSATAGSANPSSVTSSISESPLDAAEEDSLSVLTWRAHS